MAFLPRLLSCAVSIAENAGKIIKDVMSKGDLGIVAKSHAKDLQSEADRSAQRYIIGSLSNIFPAIEIVGEEDEEICLENIIDESKIEILNMRCPSSLSNIQEKEIVIWVDPLDGTTEYTQGLLDHVTVLIGIATCNGKGGVVHQPYFNYKVPGGDLGRTIWSLIGNPLIGIEVKSAPTSEFIVTTTRSHSNETVNEAVKSARPSQVVRVGGAGNKVLMLLEGKAHAYIFASPGCKKWDTCAPQAILESAGGRLVDVHGEEIPYGADAPHSNSTGVIAVAPGVDLNAILKNIPESVRKQLPLKN